MRTPGCFITESIAALSEVLNEDRVPRAVAYQALEKAGQGPGMQDRIMNQINGDLVDSDDVRAVLQKIGFLPTVFDKYQAAVAKIQKRSRTESRLDVNRIADLLGNSVDDMSTEDAHQALVDAGLTPEQAHTVIEGWYQMPARQRPVMSTEVEKWLKGTLKGTKSEATDRRARNEDRYTDYDLQHMDTQLLIKLIRAKKVTYSQVDAALEKIKAFSKLDRIGDALAKDDLKGEAVDANAKKAEAIVVALMKDAEEFASKLHPAVDKLRALGYEDDLTDWIYDAWGHIQGAQNQYASKLVHAIRGGYKSRSAMPRK